MPNEAKILSIGEIVWVESSNPNTYTYGIKFTDLKSEQLAKMREVLRT